MYDESEEDAYYARMLSEGAVATKHKRGRKSKDVSSKTPLGVAIDTEGQAKRERLCNKAPEYHLRLDELHDGGDQIKLMSLLNTFQCERILMYLEDGAVTGKAHMHAFIQTAMSKVSMNNALNYAFASHDGRGKGKGNGTQKSFKLARNAESLQSYVAKDGKVIMRHGYTDEEFDAIRKWIPKKEYKQNMVDVLHKAVGKTKKKSEIARGILQWYRDNRKPLDKYRARSYVNTIYMINNSKEKAVMEEMIDWLLHG